MRHKMDFEMWMMVPTVISAWHCIYYKNLVVISCKFQFV